MEERKIIKNKKYIKEYEYRKHKICVEVEIEFEYNDNCTLTCYIKNEDFKRIIHTEFQDLQLYILSSKKEAETYIDNLIMNKHTISSLELGFKKL